METNWKTIKMVAADLDGTLLYNSGKVTEETKAAIRALRRQGIKFGVCSGRSAVALEHMLQVWGIDQDVDFILGFNGGMLKMDGHDEQWHLLPAAEIPVILQAFKGYSVAFGEYVGHQFLCTRSNPVTRRMAARNRLEFVKVEPERLYQPTLKLMAIGTPWTISRWLAKGHRPAGCRIFRSGPFLLEIVHQRLSKLTGVQETADIYGFSLDEVVTFGNDNNDLEMLAGTVGVAMGNALPAIKEAARYVTDSNKKDGVARFIRKYLLDPSTEDPAQ